MLLQVQSRDGERVTWWTFTGNRSDAVAQLEPNYFLHHRPCKPKNPPLPGEAKLIAAETGYCVKTVKRAVDWWVAHGFLIEQDMGLAKSRAYHPQWNFFEMHWIAIAKDIKALKESWRGNSTKTPMDIKGSIAGGHQGVHRDGHHAVQYEYEEESQRMISSRMGTF